MSDVLQYSTKIVFGAVIGAVVVGTQLPDRLRGREEAAATVRGPIPDAPTPNPTSYPTPSQSFLAGRVVLDADRLGHFRADVEIDGRYVPMLVDTGASALSLTAQEAARLGIYPRASDYRIRVSTANGVVAAAVVHLRQVRLGSIVVDDVVALVAPEGQQSANLLGMTFLKKLRRFEMSGQRLILEQ